MSKNTPLLKHSARLRALPFIFFIFIFFSVYSVSNVRAQGSYYEGGSVSAGGAGDRIAPAITFTPASGIQFTGGVVTPELLANYLVALDIFLFRLAIVLAALMITIGGFQWLIAMGNSSKISNAKDTIREAILGLILALTAYVLFAQIDTNFVQFKSLALNNVDAKGDCSQFLVKIQCDQSTPYIGKQCYWACVVSEQPDLQIPCCIEPISEGSLDTAQRCTLSRTEVIQYKQKFNQDPICCCDGTQCQYSFKGNNFCLY